MQNVYKETMKVIINDAAENLFSRLELEPGFDIENLVIEKLGGKLTRENSLDEFTDACIRPYGEDKQNFEIMYDPQIKKTDPNMRFAIAHELGHLFLHMPKKVGEEKGNDQDGESTASSQPAQYELVGDFYHNKNNATLVEWEAEEFAAALLMPQSIFRERFYEVWNEDGSEQDKITKLSNIFAVPYKSIITRGRSLEIL